ncbi:MAG: hypothetical protein A3C93_05785 [Candidatus Lloydbacteria bacterium RIFCSPHIGHO2_02_FULL_54_17]|uniref:DNA 3'-5' helicase n=1 Tax=Candidatus Lloydbacteria bacterium RIFCSPHIGHO2_02_FULL_54_17 TaxID=1798664 RepID=A0A1G2DEF4_9BACT|nr:MAG: hypothetical protein A2762_02730 [Candidatus Lloydbacteria bacterium RIFCSPHIGHO2_01_FULL_54_11]OGZ11923.1 MAG: hypothetical protein A3C93_05785 [Candidatus Lloydbacteria bacterium RIFCSPHIGHO2_02_FULL_54_17]OGZ14178.1 MAG: hypothetical protein A2948_02475 [Candidatus Lloydbacteria bacterium RIFCSPLOWO2_01_FULL_54_18]OGZ15068.1 MAG: hypothetical protein A3H76_06605 [Candidatus Lloydbacteria bacterium RIFCSPLOWO2_02_FULL_54_12]
MPSSPAFEKRYHELNPAQKAAVDAIEGPVMVIAGPGTGKTEILTLRIANILLKADTQPENILALTFTEGGAFAMRKRLAELMGARAYKLNIHTFHGFCNELISRFPERFPRIVGGTPITDADQLLLIEEILETRAFPLLRPYGDPTHNVKKILSAIQALKRDAVSDKAFAAIIREESEQFAATPERFNEKGPHKGKMKGVWMRVEERIAKNEELARIFAAYEERLAQAHHYDYDDMIVEAVRALKEDGDFLLMLQEEYQYILADEHQDVNNAQNSVLELLSGFHEHPNLFIVGDEKQAIFRFQGASLENFTYFRERFPDVTLVSLTENYRSTQHILDRAHTLMSHASGDRELRKELRAQSGEGARIRIAAFPDADAEAAFVASEARRLVSEGVSADEIAVIYRQNDDAAPLIRALERDETPFSLLSEQHILDDEDILALMAILRAVEDPSNDDALGRLLFVPCLRIPPIDAFRLMGYAADRRIPLSRLIEMSTPRDLPLADPARPPSLARLLHQWGSVAKRRSLLETLDIIIAESGFLEYLIQESGSLDRIERLEHFLDIAKRLVASKRRGVLADFLRHIDVLLAHGVVKGGGRTPLHGIRLMTAHKSKGLEFTHVFVVGVFDGHWGGRRAHSSFRTTLVDSPLSGGDDTEGDERRLFYVALTRAKRSVTLTYPRAKGDGKELHPSQFTAEMDPAHLEEIDIASWEKRWGEGHHLRHAPRKNFGPELAERTFLAKRFLESGFSVSALNNYLACPWQYFFRNLVRLPESQEKFALYGTVVHETLEAFFRRWKEAGEDPGVDFLMERFRFFMERVPASEGDYRDMLAKGEKALPGYWKTYHAKWNTNIQCEFKVKGVELDLPPELASDPAFPPSVLEDGKLPKLLLRGTVDKLEFEGGDRVNVVDYKTAQPKSRNEIEGKTKNSEGDYKRQLVFYKLLLDLYDDGKWKVETGEIDFIEPDKSGKYHKEKFPVTKEEVEELKGVVLRSAMDILTFAFWEKHCEEEECRYCQLRKSIRSCD